MCLIAGDLTIGQRGGRFFVYIQRAAVFVGNIVLELAVCQLDRTFLYPDAAAVLCSVIGDVHTAHDQLAVIEDADRSAELVMSAAE